MRIMLSNSSLTKKKIWQDCPNGSAKAPRKKQKQPDNPENGYSPCIMPAACLSCNIQKIARFGNKYTKLTSTAVTTNDENDNKENIRKIVSLRLEKAKLLGFDCYANFVLDETMAKNANNVMSLLNNLWSYALPKAKAEATELQKLMDKEGKGEKLEAWDWWYYTEKLRKEKYKPV